MYQLARKLFPICRSITGDGVRKTLQILKKEYNGLQIYEVPSVQKYLTGLFQKSGISGMLILKILKEKGLLILMIQIFMF